LEHTTKKNDKGSTKTTKKLSVGRKREKNERRTKSPSTKGDGPKVWAQRVPSHLSWNVKNKASRPVQRKRYLKMFRERGGDHGSK